MTEAIVQPTKTGELHNHHFDSTIWNDFSFRDHDDDDDVVVAVVVATYAKSGTTWTQQIVAQLLLGPDPNLAVPRSPPGSTCASPPKEVKLPVVEAQTHRRFLKTHLPLDALIFSTRAKYIYVGRDGRDVVWSMYNHHANANHLWYEALNETPGRVGPPIEPPPSDIRRYLREWLERDGHPFWPFWDNVRTWWEVRHLPNVLHAELARAGGRTGTWSPGRGSPPRPSHVRDRIQPLPPGYADADEPRAGSTPVTDEHGMRWGLGSHCRSPPLTPSR